MHIQYPKFYPKFQLVKMDKDFEIKSSKMVYHDIWSLAASPDGKDIITARDNDCVIHDVCKGACTNHVDRILGNFDPPSPLCGHFY